MNECACTEGKAGGYFTSLKDKAKMNRAKLSGVRYQLKIENTFAMLKFV